MAESFVYCHHSHIYAGHVSYTSTMLLHVKHRVRIHIKLYEYTSRQTSRITNVLKH